MGRNVYLTLPNLEAYFYVLSIESGSRRLFWFLSDSLDAWSSSQSERWSWRFALERFWQCLAGLRTISTYERRRYHHLRITTYTQLRQQHLAWMEGCILLFVDVPSTVDFTILTPTRTLIVQIVDLYMCLSIQFNALVIVVDVKDLYDLTSMQLSGGHW